MLQIESFHSKSQAAQAASSRLFAELQDSRPILFLSAGGSALELLASEQSVSGQLTVGVIDERYSSELQSSNTLQFQETAFYRHNHNKLAHISAVPLTDEPLEDWATRYEQVITDWQRQHPEGKIIATLGVGADGHTAGIFPQTSSEIFNTLFEGERLVTAYDVGEQNRYRLRLTVTDTFLQQKIDMAVIYACGPEKGNVLKSIATNKTAKYEIPGVLLNRLTNATLFTDQTVV